MDQAVFHDAAPRFAIGEMARRTHVNVETVRYYERVGLIPSPVRGPGGHRRYGASHLLRLNFIRRGRELGFSLDELRALLDLAENSNRPCHEARTIAARHLAEVSAKMASLRALQRVLARTVEHCDRAGKIDCPLLETLAKH